MFTKVMIGVARRRAKELIALDDGHRESSESWADLLRSCKRGGIRAPVLAVGDGALGFWKALRDVFADTKEQRCWWHKIGNVLAALPKSAHKDAKAALAEIYNAEDRDHAERAAKAFAAAYGAKWPKAVAKITNDLDVLLAFYDFPGEHWIHLRTTDENVKRFGGALRAMDWSWLVLAGLRSALVVSIRRRSAVFGRGQPCATRRWRGGRSPRRAQRALRFVVGAGDPGPKSGAWGWKPRRAGLPLGGLRVAPQWRHPCPLSSVLWLASRRPAAGRRSRPAR